MELNDTDLSERGKTPMKTNAVTLPGEHIREELEAREWAQRDLAYILGWSDQEVNMTLSGRRKITPEAAKALGDAFNVPAELFVNMQRAYDLSQAREPDPGIAERSRIQSVYPVREMIRRGWFEDSEPGLLVAQFVRFFEVGDLSRVPHLSHLAKKSGDYREETNPKQLAWLFRVHHIAKSMDVPAFSEKKLRELLPTLRYLMVDPDDIRQVPKLLANCGVRFVVVEFLPNAKIDGVCCWLDSQSPILGMSLRHDRIDNFWFTLHHEIEHILRRAGVSRPIIDEDLSGGLDDSLPAEEQAANLAAAERCVPVKELDNFILRKDPYISERDVLGFAKVQQVHPGIVIGQIHARKKNFRFLSKHLVKVREIVISSAICDGWGKIYPVQL